MSGRRFQKIPLIPHDDINEKECLTQINSHEEEFSSNKFHHIHINNTEQHGLISNSLSNLTKPISMFYENHSSTIKNIIKYTLIILFLHYFMVLFLTMFHMQELVSAFITMYTHTYYMLCYTYAVLLMYALYIIFIYM